jgi:hypothetical protein
MTISPGHRFEATQALRQVLARAVVWGMIDSNPAKQGVDNPQRRRTEKRPFESWAQLDELAVRLGPRYGPATLRGRDRIAARRVDGARAARHRPPSTSRLRPSCRCRPLRSQRSTSSAPAVRVSFSSRRPVAVTSTSTTSATATEARPSRGRHRAAASRLRSPPYVRDLRARCRHLDLRPLALHGSQPDHDRSPLRPPRP